MLTSRKLHHDPARQRGAALMVMLIVLIIGAAMMFVASLNSSALQIEHDKKTAAALAQAKDALIGQSIIYDDYPGSLPCPDTDNDGVSDAGGASECPNYIGRLPWKTLGLPDLRDGSGERLWYTLSRNVRRYDSVRPLNSNTKGTLLVYSADGLSLQTEAGYDAVAVIFAPGSFIGAQTRSTAVEQNSAANYLDSIVIPGPITRNNATAAGPFIAGSKSATFNDQLLFITTRSLMPLVEQRVAGVLKMALTNYYATNGYYPWADTIGPTASYAANEGLNRGWLPDDAAAGGAANWSAGGLPAWFLLNEWYTQIYYSVARNHTRPPTSNCTSCIDNTLSVDGVNGVRALFFMPGTPIGTLTRAIDNLPDYLEDAQNKDDANDLYVTPTSQTGDRDRLYWLSSTSIWKP
jgi:type II secretory pathway pseudopilin PulG